MKQTLSEAGPIFKQMLKYVGFCLVIVCLSLVFRVHNTVGDDEDRRQEQNHLTPLVRDHADQFEGVSSTATRLRNSANKIRNRPTEPEVLTGRARAEIDRGEYEEAGRLLTKAMELNPDDLGCKYNPREVLRSGGAPSSSGEQQLRKMLADRKAMAAFLTPEDEIWLWAANRFGSVPGLGNIEWDAREPTIPMALAEYRPPQGDIAGTIRVKDIVVDSNLVDSSRRDETQQAFETLWKRAVYELHNIQLADEVALIDCKAAKGELSELEYVKARFVTEFKALQLTRKWYIQIYLPHAKKYSLKSDPEKWFVNRWASPEDEFRRWTDKTAYPWVPFKDYYAILRK